MTPEGGPTRAEVRAEALAAELENHLRRDHKRQALDAVDHDAFHAWLHDNRPTDHTHEHAHDYFA